MTAASLETDHELLARAVELAARGVGRVQPNPMVGAVVARDGVILGEGWHDRFGGPHAEVNAIAACGDTDLHGATLYVSQEPCCHTGKTPPCTEAILAAHIGRVVVAADDPSEKAAGRGLGILRDEGVEIAMGSDDLALTSRRLNQSFRKHARTGRPWILFKSAMTLDGKVATVTGDSQWISGEESRELAHYWRAAVDAVAVGIGTALADDPRLTARVPNIHRQPRRIVFDGLARLPLDSLLVTEASEIPLTVVVSRAAPRADADALEAAGADVVVASGENEPSRVRDALAQLGALDPPVTSILLEGGPHLAGTFFDAGEIDEIRLFLAPIVLGGASARDPLEGQGVEKIADAVQAMSLDVQQIGEDILVMARLKEW